MTLSRCALAVLATLAGASGCVTRHGPGASLSPATPTIAVFGRSVALYPGARAAVTSDIAELDWRGRRAKVGERVRLETAAPFGQVAAFYEEQYSTAYLRHRQLRRLHIEEYPDAGSIWITIEIEPAGGAPGTQIQIEVVQKAML